MMNIRSCIAAVFGLLFSSSLFSQEWEWMSVLKSYESVLDEYLYQEGKRRWGCAYRDSLKIPRAYIFDYLGNSITRENVSDLSFLDSLAVVWTGDEIDKGPKRPIYIATYAKGKNGYLDISPYRGSIAGRGSPEILIKPSKPLMRDFLEKANMDVVFGIQPTTGMLVLGAPFWGLKNNELYGICPKLDTVFVYTKEALLTDEIWNVFGNESLNLRSFTLGYREIEFDLSLYEFDEITRIMDKIPKNWYSYLRVNNKMDETLDDEVWEILETGKAPERMNGEDASRPFFRAKDVASNKEEIVYLDQLEGENAEVVVTDKLK